MEALLKVVDRVYKTAMNILKVTLLCLWVSCFFVCNELGVIAAVVGIIALLIMSVV